LALSILAIGFFAIDADSAEIGPDHLPDLMLWAWQRPEDLSYVDPTTTGVAYLAANVVLSGDEVRVAPRVQPLKVPAGTKMLSVIRMDCSRKAPPTLDSRQARLLGRKICAFASSPHSLGLQIDFDALQTERAFYRTAIEEVRSTLPKDKFFSITALASWCLFDNWMDGLPVDETIPMMFSLGYERRKILLHFKRNGQFHFPLCCRSLGISLEDDEVNALMIPLSGKRKIATRTYVFTRTAWTREKLVKVNSLLHPYEKN
jgi:hypothetical protein